MNDMPKLLLTAATVLLLCANSSMAEERKSPHEKVSIDLGGHSITINYGRPYMKGRKVVGAGLVPYGKVWRTGADEATTLETGADLDINGLRVPAGKYALFTLPATDSWTLIVNKTADQWGAFDYKAADDLGRAPMKVSASASPVEQFTIKLTPAGSNAATLEMAWENTAVTATVKLAH
jgi:DUF2911 family protein